MIRPTYNCSQQELYTVARAGWKACRQHLPAFADFKARYSDAFIDERLAEIEAATKLPDGSARNEQAESARIGLKEKVDACLNLWQRLKRYIADAYPDALQKTKCNAAGQGYYAKARNYSWESVAGLLTAASNFIENNTADLVANQNMPASFPVNFNTAKTAFEVNYQAYLNDTRQAEIKTEQRIAANNEVHAKLMRMFFDGQEIFKQDEAVRKQFVFDQVLSLASGSSPAGLKGYVTNAADGSPLNSAVITLVGTSKMATTDETGRFDLTQVGKGIYTIRVHRTGFRETTIENYEVKAGVTSKLDCQLQAA